MRGCVCCACVCICPRVCGVCVCVCMYVCVYFCHPSVNKKKRVNGDSSVMTYRGHCVLHTLVRCRFSPAFTTGQRYIYSGCATGSVVGV